VNSKLLIILAVLLLPIVAYSKPPVIVYGPNNQIVGRVYQSGTTYRYYGRNYESLGSSRQAGSYHYYYGSNNQSLGKMYNKGK